MAADRRRGTKTPSSASAAHAPDHPEPIVRELPGAPHYIYISNEGFVVREMREFLLGDVRD